MSDMKTFSYIDKNIISKISTLNENYSVTYFEYFNENKDIFATEIANVKNIEDIYSKLFIADFWKTLEENKNKANFFVAEKNLIQDVFKNYTLSFEPDKICLTHINHTRQLSFEVSFNYSKQNKNIYLDINIHKEVNLFKKESVGVFWSNMSLQDKEEWLKANKKLLLPSINSLFTVTKENMSNLMRQFVACSSLEFIDSERIQERLFPIDVFSNDKCSLAEKFIKSEKILQSYNGIAPSFSLQGNRQLFFSFQDLYLTLFVKDFKESNDLYYKFSKDINVVKLELHPLMEHRAPDYFFRVKGDNTAGFLELYKNEEPFLKFPLMSDINHVIKMTDAIIKNDYMTSIATDEESLKEYHHTMQYYVDTFLNLFPTEKENIKVSYPDINEYLYDSLYLKRLRFELSYKGNPFYYGITKTITDIKINKEEILRLWEQQFLTDKISPSLPEKKNKKRI